MKSPLGICLKNFNGEDILDLIQAFFPVTKLLDLINKIFNNIFPKEIFDLVSSASKFLPKGVPGVESLNTLLSISTKSQNLGALLPKCNEEDLTNPNSDIFEGDETACFVH